MSVYKTSNSFSYRMGEKRDIRMCKERERTTRESAGITLDCAMEKRGADWPRSTESTFMSSCRPLTGVEGVQKYSDTPESPWVVLYSHNFPSACVPLRHL